MDKQYEKDKDELYEEVAGGDCGRLGSVTLCIVVQGTQAGNLLQIEDEVETVTKVGTYLEEYSSQQALCDSSKGQGVPELVSDASKGIIIIGVGKEVSDEANVFGSVLNVAFSEESLIEGVNIEPYPIVYKPKKWKKMARNQRPGLGPSSPIQKIHSARRRNKAGSHSPAQSSSGRNMRNFISP
ncbi:hypothetical protein ACOSQ2_005172 [Xanthoceras sorbifolium]